MTAHPPVPTPTPWEYMPGVEGAAGFELDPGVRGADGFYAVTLTVDCPASVIEANARLIVTAVNAHAPLVEACRNGLQHALGHVYMGPQHGICSICEAEWPSSEGERHESDCLIARLRAALQKAGAAE